MNEPAERVTHVAELTVQVIIWEGTEWTLG